MNPQEWTDLQITAEEEDVKDKPEDDADDEDEDEDDDDLGDEDDEDDDEDDDVGTDERGKEMLKAAGDPDDADAAEPEVSSDRSVPIDDAPPGRAGTSPRNPPLSIKQIEAIEDDAPGG